MGCFKDTAKRDLTGQWTNGAWVTNLACINKCKAGVSVTHDVNNVLGNMLQSAIL